MSEALSVCRDLTEEVSRRDKRQTEGSSDQVSSTRSVGMNLARRFNAGDRIMAFLVA
jgi:hypothetical protein